MASFTGKGHARARRLVAPELETFETFATAFVSRLHDDPSSSAILERIRDLSHLSGRPEETLQRLIAGTPSRHRSITPDATFGDLVRGGAKLPSFNTFFGFSTSTPSFSISAPFSFRTPASHTFDTPASFSFSINPRANRTINETMLSEGDILRPLDPSIRAGDTDKWPEFTLTHVKVFSQATHEPVSLLAAHGGLLVRVEGFLEEVDAANGAMLVKPTPEYRKKWFAIPNVATYSFAVFDDGTFGFWAAGKAGWFEVASPSKSYAETFDNMKEATGMFYYLADKFRKSGNKFVNAPQKRITDHVRYHFEQYPASKYCRRTNIVNTKRAFYNHREFLIKSMLEGHEGLEWDVSPVLRHFKKKFPSDFTVIKEIVRVARTGARPKQGTILVNINVEGGASEADEEEEDQPELTSKNSTKRKRESILRPKSNKAAKKYTSRQRSSQSADKKQSTRAKLEEDSDTDAEGDDVEGHDSEGNASADDDAEAGNAKVTTAKPDDAEVKHFVKTKWPKDGPEPPSSYVPTYRKVKPPAKSPKVRVWTDNANNLLPSYYEPHGLGDTWTCPYGECSYKVWNARDDISIEMIKEHFVDTHAGKAADLVKEESRPWTSVDHLMQRIKGMGALSKGVARRY